jgi:hypothetical protein
MKLHALVLAASASIIQPSPPAHEPKYVFAHVVVGDTAAHTKTTWGVDIALAQATTFDAFVLNIAHGDPNVPIQVSNAFAAAKANRYTFKFFFTLYYAGGARHPVGNDSVVSYLNT